MTRQKIKPMSGQPLVLTLESAGGQEVKSQYNGVEYRYDVTLHGEPALIYLPAEARDAIARLRAADGDEIRLLKQGANGSARWDARLMSDAHLPVPVLQAPRPQPQPAPEPQAQVSYPTEDLLVRCFECAGRALLRAHGTLSSKMENLEPPIWEDVRAVGISLFIERNRRENGR